MVLPEKALIAPSILSADFGHLADEIAAVEQAGADWIHVDVMDGHFVPNLTMGPVVLQACRSATTLPLDVHLMIEAPDRLIDAFAAAGASTLTVHLEACTHLHRTIQAIRAAGCRPGVALNPATPFEWIRPVLADIDLALVMTVNPGFSGQTFIPGMLSKIRRIREALDEVNPACRLEVDGGVSSETVGDCRAAGAGVFVAGSAIFGHPEGPSAGVQAIRSAINN